MHQGIVEKQPSVEDKYMTLHLVDDNSLVWNASSPVNLTASGTRSSADQTWKIVNCRSAQVTTTDTYCTTLFK